MLTFGALPWLRIWRQNTGKAYGYSMVAGALNQMRNGNFKAGMEQLRHAPLITFGTPGAADIQGILGGAGGRFIAIEVKGPKGVQSDEQKKWQAMITSHGGIYILAYSVQDVETYFDILGFKV